MKDLKYGGGADAVADSELVTVIDVVLAVCV